MAKKKNQDKGEAALRAIEEFEQCPTQEYLVKALSALLDATETIVRVDDEEPDA